jgi:hypothetical protein
MSRKSWTVGLMIPLAAAGAVSTAPAASAAATAPAAVDRGVVRQFGSCSGRSDLMLDATTRGFGRIALRLELDGRAGQMWNVRITQNGDSLFRDTMFTRGGRFSGTGSFMVRESADNMPGRDMFMARAMNNRTGETCRATVTVGRI